MPSRRSKRRRRHESATSEPITPATPEGRKTWEALLQGLREQGYAAERTLAIERRYLEGKNELASTFVAELLQMNVDVIVTSSPLVARTANCKRRRCS
jgi:hypothetical protein